MGGSKPVKEDVMMRTQKIDFRDKQALCVFPEGRSSLAQAISDLGLKGRYPVIVLIGGEIEESYALVTQKAIEAISRVAEELHAVVICGGTNFGVMAEIGQTKARNRYK